MRFLLYCCNSIHRYALINAIPGGGGGGDCGDFDILSKIFVKNHSPGTTYFVKKHTNPHPRAGELCQRFLPRGNAIHSRHPPRPNHTKNCTSLSLGKQKSFFHSIPRNQIVINTKMQLMRKQEANILIFLNS